VESREGQQALRLRMYLEKKAGKGVTIENDTSAKVLTSLSGPKAAWWILKVVFLPFVHVLSYLSDLEAEYKNRVFCCHVQPRVFVVQGDMVFAPGGGGGVGGVGGVVRMSLKCRCCCLLIKDY
jgi:hypothetical protein